MNVEIGTEAAQFPEKEYIKGIFIAVCLPTSNAFKLLTSFSYSLAVSPNLEGSPNCGRSFLRWIQ
jgi:hypothetical protein